MKERVLRLTLKKYWFDLIYRMIKKHEYRELKKYWGVRLINKDALPLFYEVLESGKFGDIKKEHFREYDYVEFINGYSSDAPRITLELKGIEIGVGRKDWGALDTPVFMIKLGEIVSSNIVCGKCYLWRNSKEYKTIGQCTAFNNKTTRDIEVCGLHFWKESKLHRSVYNYKKK